MHLFTFSSRVGRLAGMLLFGPVLLMLIGCGSSNRLHEHDFRGHRAAVIAAIPPHPVVFTDDRGDEIDVDDPVGSFFRVGASMAKYAEAEQAQARLDSALTYIDVPERVALRTLRTGARYLGYKPVDYPEDADYILDIRIADYGLLASSWEATVQFELKAEMRLLDARTQKTIWKERIREVEPVSRSLIGLGPGFNDLFTTQALARLSVEEMVEALERLADYTADHLSAVLRHDFYESRSRAE